MSAVWLHVYDVTNSISPKTNNTILGINRFFRDGIGIGGIFHGAIQVYEEEWSFGYCENGSGVFPCAPKSNPMYTYRETVYIGNTPFSQEKVKQILLELSKEWPGYSYDLLSRNCNHFCDEFCEQLSVPKIPAWVNRFANAGDAAVDAVANTMERMKQARSDVAAAGRIAVRFIFGGISRPPNGELSGQEEGSSLRNMFSRARTFPRSDGDATTLFPGGEEESGSGYSSSSFKLNKSDSTSP